LPPIVLSIVSRISFVPHTAASSSSNQASLGARAPQPPSSALELDRPRALRRRRRAAPASVLRLPPFVGTHISDQAPHGAMPPSLASSAACAAGSHRPPMLPPGFPRRRSSPALPLRRDGPSSAPPASPGRWASSSPGMGRAQFASVWQAPVPQRPLPRVLAGGAYLLPSSTRPLLPPRGFAFSASPSTPDPRSGHGGASRIRAGPWRWWPVPREAMAVHHGETTAAARWSEAASVARGEAAVAGWSCSGGSCARREWSQGGAGAAVADQWWTQEFAVGYATQKIFKTNTQYNGQLSYHDHNKYIIITSSCLSARRCWGSEAPAVCHYQSCRCRDGEVGWRQPNCQMPVWGDRRRAEGRRRTGADAEPGNGGWGEPQAKRQREQFFCILAFLLDCVELGP
jgi:hypothetical protein